MANTPRTEAYDQPCPLMEGIRTKLKEDPRSLPIISAECGIPMMWLYKFTRGEYKNPSVNRIAHLYRFLTGKELTV